MSRTSGSQSPSATERLGVQRRRSYSRLAIADGLFGFGVLTVAAGLIGLADDTHDALVLLGLGLAVASLGGAGHLTFEHARRPPPGRVIAGLASTWSVLVLAGTIVYLLTGTIDRVDDALFESAAGFSTTALTTVDPEELSVPMSVFRGTTQWLGGLVGLLAAIVALPSVLQGSVQIPKGMGRRIDRLAPAPITGRRRVLALYAMLTTSCGIGYVATGMGAHDALVHAMTTVSSGGFSTRADSFASFGGGTRVVATCFMILAGTSYFVLWWLIRGDTRRFSQSPELRMYLTMIAGATVLVTLAVDDLSIGNALFAVASAASTTGFAIDDWTVFPSAALSVLLVVVATGSMGAAAGSGLRVVRARTLIDFANRELRRQLDPNAVTVIKHAGRAVPDDELERLTGYQIAHFGLCAIGAFLLTTAGVDVVAALWTAISVVSTAGPSPGTGAYGDVGQLGSVAQLLLIPGMLAGRLTLLPLLMAIVSLMRAKRLAVLRVKRFLRTSP